MNADVSLIRQLEEFEAFQPEWEAFLRADRISCHYYQDPAVYRQHFTGTGEISPLIVVLRRGNKIECVAPFLISRERLPLRFSVFQIGSYPLRRLRLVGAQFLYASGADRERCARRIFDELEKARAVF